MYNTSSITTALYHGIGDTKMESYTYQNQNRNQNRNQNPNQNYTRCTRYRHFSLTTSQSLSLPSLSRLPSRDKTCSQKHTTDSSLLFTRRRRLRLGALVFKAATKADSCHSLRVVYVSERRETLHVSALGERSRRRRRRMKRRQKRSERTTTTKKKAPCFKVSTNLPSTGVITNAKAT